MRPSDLWKFPFLAWLAVYVIVIFFRIDHPLDSDEGVILTGAWNLLNGRGLYSDFFSIIPPASYYLIYLVWLVGGESYGLANAVAVISVFVAAIGVERLCRLVTDSRLSHIAALLFVLPSGFWPLINHNMFNVAFVIWATYFFVRGIETTRRKDFFVAGLLTGISILFLHTRGVTAFGAFMAFLGFLALRGGFPNWAGAAGALLAGATVALSPVLLLVPPEVLWNAVILFPINHYMDINKIPLTNFWGVLLTMTVAIYVLRNTADKKIWGLIWLQLVLLFSTLLRPDFFHMTLVLFPLYALLPLILVSMWERPRLQRILLGTGMAFPFLLIVSSYAKDPLRFLRFPNASKYQVVSYVRQNCKDITSLYAGPFIPGLYFETRKLSPIAHDYLLTGFHTEAQFLKAAETLQQRPPECAVLVYSLVEKFKYRRANPVDIYIERNYEQVFRDGDIMIYRLRHD